MIGKNTSERRFNTAAARIMLSSKLPSDFFRPSREKDANDTSLCLRKHQSLDKHANNPTKDPLLFTFHRSNSQDKIRLRDNLLPHVPCKISNSSKMGQTKLPPVSLGMWKQNGGDFWSRDVKGYREKLKKLGRISNRILQESNLFRQQISQVLH